MDTLAKVREKCTGEIRAANIKKEGGNDWAGFRDVDRDEDISDFVGNMGKNASERRYAFDIPLLAGLCSVGADSIRLPFSWH